MKKIEENVLIIGADEKNDNGIGKKLRQKGFDTIFAGRHYSFEENERYIEWGDCGSLDMVLKNINCICIVCTGAVMPEAYEQMQQLICRLERWPFLKVVWLSGRGQETVKHCEGALANSSLNWTIIRSAWLNQCFGQGYFLEGILSGEVAFMADTVKEPFVDLDDLLDVVAEVLHSDMHSGKKYEVTGDELISFKEAVELIGRCTDRRINYNVLSRNKYRQLLKKAGYSTLAAAYAAQMTAEMLDGRNENLGDGVSRVLRRKPKRFIDFAHLNQFELGVKIVAT